MRCPCCRSIGRDAQLEGEIENGEAGGFGRRVGRVGVVVVEATVVGAVWRVQRLTRLVLRIRIRHGG